MEPFRPLIGDSIALDIFNRNQVKTGDFEYQNGACYLSKDGRRTFFKAYKKRINTQIRLPDWGILLSYRRAIYLYARQIALWCQSKGDPPVFITTR